MATVPEIFRYLDYRAFLRDWFDARKAANPRFSHRVFARRIGQKSPSLLADVIARRRNLTPEYVELFNKALGLSAEEAHFFACLVSLDQASTTDERNSAFEIIAAAKRFREARAVEGDSYRYLSNWYIPAIRELVRRPDFRADPTWIARTLRPTITPAQAKQALAILRSLGMITLQEDGWQQSEGTVATPKEVAGLAVHNYHCGMLSLAQESISRHRPFERHYTALTVCIPESMVSQLKQEINTMAERLLEVCDSAPGEPQRVYQIHLHTFPLSAAVEES